MGFYFTFFLFLTGQMPCCFHCLVCNYELQVKSQTLARRSKKTKFSFICLLVLTFMVALGWVSMSGRCKIHHGKLNVTILSKVLSCIIVQSWFQCPQISYKDLTLPRRESQWSRRNIISLAALHETGWRTFKPCCVYSLHLSSLLSLLLSLFIKNHRGVGKWHVSKCAFWQI